MILQNLSNIATISGVLIILVGVFIIYFGRVILKSKKEMTKDWVSEVLSGSLFLFWILIAGVIVFILPRIIFEAINSGNLLKTISVYLVYTILFSFQFLIFIYLYKRLNDETKFKFPKNIDKEVILLSVITMIITYFFFKVQNYFFLIISIILTLLILTYLSAIYGKERKESNYNKFLKFVFINENKKPIIAKIKRLGDEFIDIIPEDEKKDEISINKSQIFSIKKLDNKK